MFYVTNPEDYTDVTKEEINNALISSRTRWKMTAEGIENTVGTLGKKDGNFYLLFKGADYKNRVYKLTYKEQGNNIVKFYSKSRLEGDYGKDIAELVELLFTDPEEYSLTCAAMNSELTDQMIQKDEGDSRRRKEWEENKQIRRPTPQRSNLVSSIEDIIHSDDESTSSDILNESLMETIFNATDAELQKEFGEYDAREIRGLKLAEDKMKETRGRIISKIALLDEQVGQEKERNTRRFGRRKEKSEIS